MLDYTKVFRESTSSKENNNLDKLFIFQYVLIWNQGLQFVFSYEVYILKARMGE